MLEFYIAYYDYNDMMNLTEDLFERLANEVLGKTDLEFDGKTISLARPWKRLPMKQALVEVGHLAEAALEDEEQLRRIAQEHKFKDAAKLSKGKLWGELLANWWSRTWLGLFSLPSIRATCRRCPNRSRTTHRSWSGLSCTSPAWKWPMLTAS